MLRIVKHTFFLLLLIVMTFYSCEKPQSRAMTISKIKNAAKLATVEIVVSKMIIARPEAAKWKQFLGNDGGRFLAETEASIKAGIDLDKIDEGRITINGKSISLVLPPVEILNFSYPAEKFKVNEQYTDFKGVANRARLDLLDSYYRQAELDIRSNFKLLGVNEQAENKTRTFLQKLLSGSGYEEIEITFSRKASDIQAKDRKEDSDEN